MWRRRRPDFTKGALAGLAGGLIASFVMNQFQAAVSKVKASTEAAQRPDAVGRHGAQPLKSQDSGEDPATVKAAVAVSEAVLDRELSPEEKEPAGNAVHYVFGIVAGGVYGVLAEKAPAARA